MTGFAARWLVTVSLAGFLVTPVVAHAQSGRPWVDPPAESDATPLRPTATPAPVALPAKPAETVTSPAQQASKPTLQSDTVNADAELQRPSDASRRNAAMGDDVKPKPSIERKTRASQQASSSARSQKRDAQVERRREARTRMSQAEARNAFERRARFTRYGSVQEGLDAGLQVMRLRTIQLPDGRRITVLTRPDQDIALGMPDGY
jgi:hypothetical protein